MWSSGFKQLYSVPTLKIYVQVMYSSAGVGSVLQKLNLKIAQIILYIEQKHVFQLAEEVSYAL